MTGEVRERQHVGVELDAERVSHEATPCLDATPRLGVGRRQLAAQRLVRQRDTVFDVRREVRYYFATERGRLGYEANRNDFNRLIWKTASPKWTFDDAVYARSAAAFDNPDHVDIVVHNYRWRLGLADGERKYDALEARLAVGPAITVPSITMEGDANGAPHAPPAAYAKKFTGKYQHRTLAGGIGHNLPQEAPREFAQAIVDVASP